MSWKYIQAEADALIAELPRLPQPWDVDKLCRKLATLRNRSLILRSLDLSALPFGLWYSDGHTDYVIYRSGISGYHRDHTILHEVCHILAGHNSAEKLNAASSSSDLTSFLEQAMHNRLSNYEEELAETFASTVLRLASHCGLARTSEFEQRAAAMFGAA